MSSARFSLRNLRAEIRSTDGWDYGVDFSKPLDLYIEEAESIIKDPLAALQDFNFFENGKRAVYSYSSYPTVLSLRVLSSYLKRRYNLQSETREAITRGLIQALSDSSEMHILRRDISSFYESLPTEPLVEGLLYTDVLDPRARRMLEAFFEVHCLGSVGLPRGLGLSATLSEFIMKPVDSAIRLLPGVYRYHRFVDDIVVLCTDPSVVSPKISTVLPSPLRLNDRKSEDVSLTRPAGDLKLKSRFEYLGYRYEIDMCHSPSKFRKLRVSIAQRKIDRIRTKIILAARAYIASQNYAQFRLRILYLTGNYKFLKKRPIVSTGKAVVRSGIYYNYRYCGDYQGTRVVAHPMSELKGLDWFLQNSILGTRYPLGSAIMAQLNAQQVAALRRLSFAQGHLKIYDSKVTSDQVKMIKSIWRNV